MATKASPAKPAAKSTAAKKPGTEVAVAKKTGGAVSTVSVKEMMAAQLAALANKTAPATGNQVRATQDKQFMFPDGTKSRDPFQVVIVDFVSRNEFYEGEYDKDNPESPICMAVGDDARKLVPADESPSKQADDCSSCPMNAFGSKGKGKACKNTRYLAILPPDADADTPLWTIKVSPTGIKAFDAYVNGVARTMSTPPVGVVTTISFDDNSDYPTLVFGEPELNEEVATHIGRVEEAREVLLAIPDMTPRERPVPAPKTKARPAGRR